MNDLRTLLLCALALGACQPLPEQPSGPPSTAVEVTIEPEAPLDEAPSVLRLRLPWSERSLDSPEDVLLVSGELSDYHVGRIRRRDLPKTLIARIVPALTWIDGDALVVAPSAPLLLGERYALASPSLGRIAELRAASDARPLLVRLWPPAGAGTGSTHVLYCGEQPLAPLGSGLRLDPGSIEASITPESEICVAISPRTPPGTGERLIPPPLVAGYAFDPSPIEHAPHLPPPAASCIAPELRFGPGCALVEDDRAVVRSGIEPMLWIARLGSLTTIESAASGARWVLRGLAPSSENPIALKVLDLSGRAQTASLELQTGSPRPRLVLNEVLADPLGAEPAQEWVEIVNDGVVGVDLAGWTIEDAGGASELPAALLGPGAYALIVREDFSIDDGLDVVVSPGALVVRVTQLGKNGLSNTGEPLALRAPDGLVVSRFPAFPKPKPGISVARRRIWDLDDDPGAFRHHAEPGSSPGSPNEVAGPAP
jgi:hypothetical protein